ncbi:MAG: dienelactone hydrolase family protein [Chitinophagaceae bacterium]|nr:dienelactone hydrolase family protein [Chitinophagaceae bacterium]
MHKKNLVLSGVNVNQASRVFIMLHGRGATANDIVGIGGFLNTENAHIIAPQATNNTWYPYSFLAPLQQNEPWLSSALKLLEEILLELFDNGFVSRQIFVIGFSQGACLTLEFATQNAMHFGGIIAFTGGLIGDSLDISKYKGNFENTKIFIGNSDKDPHVPLVRSQQSKSILATMGADVTLKIYPNMPHIINQDEIEWVNNNIL